MAGSLMPLKELFWYSWRCNSDLHNPFADEMGTPSRTRVNPDSTAGISQVRLPKSLIKLAVHREASTDTNLNPEIPKQYSGNDLFEGFSKGGPFCLERRFSSVFIWGARDLRAAVSEGTWIRLKWAYFSVLIRILPFQFLFKWQRILGFQPSCFFGLEQPILVT